MTKFRVGDRVRVCGTNNNILEVVPATVLSAIGSLLHVEADYGIDEDGEKNSGWTGYVHSRQCRKLKPKPPKSGAV